MRKAVSVISAMLPVLIMAVLLSGRAWASQESERETLDMSRLKLMIGENEVPVVWEENESTAALFEKAEDHPVTVDMAMYGGFEQVGPLGFDLPANDEQTTTSPGDIVLYSGNQIVVFYGSNSWAYTRLGRVDLDPQAMMDLLGGGDVTLDISVLGDADTQTYAVEDVVLNSGYSMPVIGLGTWTLSDDEARESVYQALKTGMRLIDTARYYQCEKGVGEGLQRAIDEGIVSREEVFITSKIMPSDYDRAAQGIEASLSDLGVSYIDLMLIHQPGSSDEEVYRAMEEAVREGKVRSIGISNYYTPEAVDEVLSYAEILPAVIQNENHLYYQNRELQEYVKPYGIVIESWYPFGGRGHTQDHFGNETVMEIAGAHQKTPAQVILRWQVQSGYIAIPGSSNPEHIAENFNIFDFELSGEEMDRLDGLNRSERYENW
jgi:diketogulonate reductase-like aldo/keto reductase